MILRQVEIHNYVIIGWNLKVKLDDHVMVSFELGATWRKRHCFYTDFFILLSYMWFQFESIGYQVHCRE